MNAKPTQPKPEVVKKGPNHADDCVIGAGPEDDNPIMKGTGPSRIEPNGRGEDSVQHDLRSKGDAPGPDMLGTEGGASKCEDPRVSRKKPARTAPKTGGEEAESNQASPAGEIAASQ